MSTPRDLDRRFLSTVSGWIVSLPHDLKVLVEAKDDPNLDRGARETAAGALLYALNPDTSGESDFVGYAEKAIVARLALKEIGEHGGEGAPDFRDRFGEIYGTLEEDLRLCEQAMGELYPWLAGKIPTLPKAVYKQKKVAPYIDEDENVELLYEDFLAFQTDYPIDEDKLSMRLKKTETLLEPLKRKAAEDKKKIA